MAKKNRSEYSVSRILTPIALSVLLAACSSQPSDPDTVQTPNIYNTPVESSEFYLIKADTAEGSLQIDWLILSLKAAIAEGDTDLANRIIGRLAQLNMSQTQQAEWQLARAQLLLNDDQPTDAIKQLNFRNNWLLEQDQWQRYYALRSEIYQALFAPLEAAREQIFRADFLMEEDQQQNIEQIWALMNSATLEELEALNIGADDQELAGWQQLAIYNQSIGHNLPQLKRAYQQWIDENFSHPAALYTPQEIKEILALDITQPSRTALILPLSGKYEKQARIIRDGFMFAMLQDDNRLEDSKTIVLDSNRLDSVRIQQQLIEQDIEFIVGPLRKEKIEEIQQAQQTSAKPIPMLALNFPDNMISSTDFCYVTLSPEQEATEAARHLKAEGFKYPLVIAPKGNYGRRMANAFNQQWLEDNDAKSDIAYFSSKNQLQLTVNTVFGLQDSQRRIAQMEQLLDLELESEQRSRRDIDAVYIVASDSELNLIKPFISVAINPEATPPKLYANSRSNTGISRPSQDLTGVIYSDIPFLIDNDQALSAEMEGLWESSNNQQKRLRALGMDAYSLINALPNMKLSTEYTWPGQTGVLSIDDECVVQRQISWSEYGLVQ